jgi:hypothetical protein
MWRFSALFLGMVVTAALVAPAMARAFSKRPRPATEARAAREPAPARRLTTSDYLDPFAEPQPITIRHVHVVPAVGGENPLAGAAPLDRPWAGSASPMDMLIATPIIERALARYPDDAFVGAEIQLVVAAGIHTPDRDAWEWVGWFRAASNGVEIGIATRHENGDFLSAREIERTVHHELSSWVLDHVDRDVLTDVWKSFLPHGFEYYGHDATLRPTDEVSYQACQPDQLLEVGFAELYALTSFENDFNTLAERAFCPDAEFEQAVKTSPFVQWKLRVMSRVYERAGLPFPLAFDEESSTFSIAND